MGSRIGLGSRKPTTIGGYNLNNGQIRPDVSYNSSYSGSNDEAKSSNDEDVLSAYINDMYTRYAPQEVAYDARSEEEIRSSVAAWLRPSYDQAITNRQEQTSQNKANLDADAISRGMGASTYVTDVKNRQQNAEAGDIATLEADYGATLSQYVLDGVDSENDRKLEADTFNASQRQSAYDQAYSAALALYAQYNKSGGSTKRSGTPTTTLENCDSFLAMLSGDERRVIYESSTAQGAQYRAELLASVGSAGYIQLMGRYPAKS